MSRLKALGSRLATLPTRLKTTASLGTGDPTSWRAGKGKTSERGYGWRWQKARAAFLSNPDNVLCRMCEAEGFITEATVVDHVVPHRGDDRLFWDQSNWQPLCKAHHDGAKARAEGRGGRRKIQVVDRPDRPMSPRATFFVI